MATKLEKVVLYFPLKSAAVAQDYVVAIVMHDIVIHVTVGFDSGSDALIDRILKDVRLDCVYLDGYSKSYTRANQLLALLETTNVSYFGATSSMYAEHCPPWLGAEHCQTSSCDTSTYSD